MVLAPSSHMRPLYELLLIFPPARSSASKRVTLKPFSLSLYAAASPLKSYNKIQNKIEPNESKRMILKVDACHMRDFVQKIKQNSHH